MSSEQASIREAIQLLSQLFTSCGCPKFPSEIFRRAKFSQPSVTRELWQLLSHAVRVSNAMDKGHAPAVPFASISDSNLPHVALQVRGYLLVSLGYTRTAFFSVDHSEINSRELLLAFGWLLNQSKLLLRLKTYHATAIVTLKLPFSAAGRKSRESVEQDCERFQKQLEALVDSIQSSSDTRAAKNALQMFVWVRGKLLAQWKASALAQLAYQKLATSIHKSTQAARGGEMLFHLSVHEVFLLKHPKHMSVYLAETEKHLNVLERLIVWELQHETVFWQWMQSVLDQESKEISVNGSEKQELAHNIEELKAQVNQLECEVKVLLNEKGSSSQHKTTKCSELTVDSGMQWPIPPVKHICSGEGNKSKSLEPLLEELETLSLFDQARFVPRQSPAAKHQQTEVNITDSSTSTAATDDDLIVSEEAIYKLKVELCEHLH